jgi:hypothetical protein
VSRPCVRGGRPSHVEGTHSGPASESDAAAHSVGRRRGRAQSRLLGRLEDKGAPVCVCECAPCAACIVRRLVHADTRGRVETINFTCGQTPRAHTPAQSGGLVSVPSYGLEHPGSVYPPAGGRHALRAARRPGMCATRAHMRASIQAHTASFCLHLRSPHSVLYSTPLVYVYTQRVPARPLDYTPRLHP